MWRRRLRLQNVASVLFQQLTRSGQRCIPVDAACRSPPLDPLGTGSPTGDVACHVSTHKQRGAHIASGPAAFPCPAPPAALSSRPKTARSQEATMTEARAWHTIGLALMGGAVAAWLVPAVKNGLRPENTIMLGLDMGAAFIGMAGAAAAIAGRVMGTAQGDAASTSKQLKRGGLVVGIWGALLAADAVGR